MEHYRPVTAVWEVTMGCNMRCGHCGSSCAEALPDELSTDEAFALIDDMASLGLKWVTISGGEPLTRRDLPQLLKRLSSRGVAPNIITNGWMLDKPTVAVLKDNGVATLAISVDGTKAVHDEIRKKGSYDRIMEAFAHLKEAGVTTGAVTTVSKKNIDLLPELRRILIEAGVKSWQLQIGLPMGNLKEKPDWLIEYEDVNRIIDISYETARQGDIIMYPADCVGYYTEKEAEIRRISFRLSGVPMWEGCNAGIRSFGVLQNGDILGCTSIRSAEFIEGNIKNKRLPEIWNDPNAFSWRRSMTRKDLMGDCRICVYASKCLGGCPNTRLTMEGNMRSENRFCSYNLALKKMKAGLPKEQDAGVLFERAALVAQEGRFQESALLAGRATVLKSDYKDAYNTLGFAEFMCGNYDLSEAANRKALEIDPNDTYAMKGLGLALHRQGKSEEGIRLVEEAARRTGYADRDILEDLNIIKREAAMAGRLPLR